MEYEILDISQKETWTNYLRQLDLFQQDIFFTPEYYELFENKGDGKAACFVFRDRDEIALYPFLINNVNDLGFELKTTCYDIQGAYGYNGIVTNSIKESFLENFSKVFLNYIINANIIAEFVRFDPVLKNHLLSTYIQPVETFDNVVIDLKQGIEEIWNSSFDRGVRKAIKKAEKHNLRFSFHTGKEMDNDLLKTFLQIYYNTMERASASEFYFFSGSFFDHLIKSLSDNSLFVFTAADDEIISTELVLFKGEIAYGFLGGTLAEKYIYSPNSFLRYELIKLLRSMGLKFYSIGGGHQRNDSIYNFKKSFSRKIDSLFYIGKKVHNQPMYNEVIHQWDNKFPGLRLKYENQILCYRNTK